MYLLRRLYETHHQAAIFRQFAALKQVVHIVIPDLYEFKRLGIQVGNGKTKDSELRDSRHPQKNDFNMQKSVNIIYLNFFRPCLLIKLL